MNRRAEERRTDSHLVVDLALGDIDPRAADRRQHNRRRGDAHSIAETLATQDISMVKMVPLGGTRERQSAVYSCGCMAVDPSAAKGSVQLLQCPTHAELQAKLRRRQTDRQPN